MRKPAHRRSWTALGLTAGVIASVFALAPTALAAGTLVDNGNGSITANNVNFSGNNGLWFCTTTAAASCVYPGNAYDFGTGTSGTYTVGSQVFTPTSPGYVSLPAGYYNVQLVDAPNASITLTNVRIGAAPAPTPASTSTAPAGVPQAFGAPMSGTCDEAADPALNWGGAPAGGWTKSWQQWVNNGAGGAVCQRTLTYVASRAHWTVAN